MARESSYCNYAEMHRFDKPSNLPQFLNIKNLIIYAEQVLQDRNSVLSEISFKEWLKNNRDIYEQEMNISFR